MSGRRSFWPTVLAGAAAAALAAVAGHQGWASRPDSAATAITSSGGDPAERPAVTALALVALAAWGVLLVTRGIVRRGVAGLAALAALAAVAASVVGLVSARDDVRSAGWSGYTTTPADPTLTVWGFIALLAALLAAVAGGYALVRAAAWPEMGRKYDAPGSAAPTAAATPETPLDVWKALDEGRDPTAGEDD